MEYGLTCLLLPTILGWVGIVVGIVAVSSLIGGIVWTVVWAERKVNPKNKPWKTLDKIRDFLGVVVEKAGFILLIIFLVGALSLLGWTIGTVILQTFGYTPCLTQAAEAVTK